MHILHIEAVCIGINNALRCQISIACLFFFFCFVVAVVSSPSLYLARTRIQLTFWHRKTTNTLFNVLTLLIWLIFQERYKNLVSVTKPIESHLMRRLPELLNAEIVLGAIENTEDSLLNWIRYSFDYARHAHSPEYLNEFIGKF